MKKFYLSIFIFCISTWLQNCSTSKPIQKPGTNSTEIRSRVVIKNKVPVRTINTGNISADRVAGFAESLQGVPYKWGGESIRDGFDCSGFIYYVLTHYNIKTPRTSVEYTNAGKEILFSNSRRGDIILFTGSDANSGIVGHMGMITKNNKGKVEFIHCASGDGIGVIVSEMNAYFVPRFVKVIRIFKVT